jgi:hypothetical protein
LRDSLFHSDHTGCRVDQLLIESAPVVADGFDLALELRLVFQRPSLLGAQRFKLVVTRLERVDAFPPRPELAGGSLPPTRR